MEIRMNWATKQATMKNIKIINILINNILTVVLSCRGSTVTFFSNFFLNTYYIAKILYLRHFLCRSL